MVDVVINLFKVFTDVIKTDKYKSKIDKLADLSNENDDYKAVSKAIFKQLLEDYNQRDEYKAGLGNVLEYALERLGPVVFGEEELNEFKQKAKIIVSLAKTKDPEEVLKDFLARTDSSTDDFRELINILKEEGFNIKYDYLVEKTRNNLLMECLVHGRFDAFLYLVKEEKFDFKTMITGDDFRIDGQRAPFYYKINNGVKVIFPSADAADTYLRQKDDEVIQSRVTGVKEILEYIDRETDADEKNKMMLFNLASFYMVGDLVEKYLAKNSGVEFNSVSTKGRRSSPLQIAAANDLRPEIYQIMRTALEQDESLKVDAHAVGFVVLSNLIFNPEFDYKYIELLLGKLSDIDREIALKKYFDHPGRMDEFKEAVGKYPQDFIKIVNNEFKKEYFDIQKSEERSGFPHHDKILVVLKIALEKFNSLTPESKKNAFALFRRIPEVYSEITPINKLSMAIQAGDVEGVKSALREGADPDSLLRKMDSRPFKNKRESKAEKQYNLSQVLKLADQAPEGDRKEIKEVLVKYKEFEKAAIKAVLKSYMEEFRKSQGVKSQSSVLDGASSHVRNSDKLEVIKGVIMPEEKFGFFDHLKILGRTISRQIKWSEAKSDYYFEKHIRPVLKYNLEKSFAAGEEGKISFESQSVVEEVKETAKQKFAGKYAEKDPDKAPNKHN